MRRRTRTILSILGGGGRRKTGGRRRGRDGSATDPPLHAVHCCYAVLMEWRGGGGRPERLAAPWKAAGKPQEGRFGVKIMCGDRAFAYPAASPCGPGVALRVQFSDRLARMAEARASRNSGRRSFSLRRNRVELSATGCADLHNRRQISASRLFASLGRALHACEVKVWARETSAPAFVHPVDGTTSRMCTGRRLHHGRYSLWSESDCP